MSGPVTKTLARIKKSVESGDFYEAQQMYKTSYHRSKARQQLDDALQILQEGATTQLSHGQVTCGVELGMLLVEAYTTSAVPADEAAVGRLLAIVQALPPPAQQQQAAAAQGGGAGGTGGDGGGAYGPAADECARLVAAAVKWASKAGAEGAARRLHSAFAAYLWASYGSQGFGRALSHFIRGQDAAAFAEALHACAASGPAEEVDLWLLRALLQVPAVAGGGGGDAAAARLDAQVSYARALREAFLARSGPLDSPTGHFAELLLLALESRASSPRSHALLRLARDRYGSGVLGRDPQGLEPALERVEAAYWGVRRGGGGGMGGLLGDLFKSLTQAA